MKTILIRNVPEKLSKDLRLIALQQDKSMNALLLELMKEKVAGSK